MKNKPTAAETNKAIRASIKHWKKMRGDRKCGEKPKADYCSLCALFFDPELYVCNGCPVKKQTGLNLCSGTPFGKSHDAFYFGTDAEWKAAADEEIAFLESLLPHRKAKGSK